MVLDWVYPPDPRVAKEAKSLIEAGHEVHLLCLRHEPEKDREVVGGLHVHRWFYRQWLKNKLSAVMLTVPIHRWWWRKRINAFVKTVQPEVLHCHDLPLVKAVATAAKSAQIPIVLDLHETYPATVASSGYASSILGRLLISVEAWRRYERYWVACADRVIAVTEEMREREIAEKGISPKKIVSVPNHVDLESYYTESRPCPHAEKFVNRQVAVHTGGTDEVRGVDFVIRAVPEVVKSVPNLLIMVVGDGSFRPELERLTDELRVREWVFFTGWQKSDDLASYVALAQVGLVTLNRAEQTLTTSPNKLTEYMALGTPVLVTDCGAPARLVERAGAGIVVEPEDPKSMADGLIEMLNDRDPKWSENGKNAVQRKYNWAAAAKALTGMYGQLAENIDSSQQSGG
jgi:glycosyltransferase involved in cell wall biosynthesis